MPVSQQPVQQSTQRLNTQQSNTPRPNTRQPNTQQPMPLGRRHSQRHSQSENGSVTAEYAVATMAAVGFAGLLVVILRGDEVRNFLTELVRTALTYAG